MRIVLFIVVLTVACACGNSSKIPKDIIPKDKMEEIMWDMVLADRYSAQYILKDSVKKDVRKETFKVYDQVFQIHHITQEQFLKSYKFYMNRPDISKIIFDSLSNRGNRNREESYKKAQ